MMVVLRGNLQRSILTILTESPLNYDFFPSVSLLTLQFTRADTAFCRLMMHLEHRDIPAGRVLLAGTYCESCQCKEKHGGLAGHADYRFSGGFGRV